MVNESSNGTRILVAGDYAIFREGLRKLLGDEPGFRVVGEAADAAEAVTVARQLKPNVVLLDPGQRLWSEYGCLHIGLPPSSGLKALRELETAQGPVRTILLVDTIEKNLLLEALAAGACGIVLKESTTALLVKAIRCVTASQYWLDGKCICNIVQALRDLQCQPREETRRNLFHLTARELQILRTIVEGYANKDIAQNFSISEQTVKHHLTNIFDKLGVSNRLELALFAIHHRLVGEQGAREIVGKENALASPAAV